MGRILIKATVERDGTKSCISSHYESDAVFQDEMNFRGFRVIAYEVITREKQDEIMREEWRDEVSPANRHKIS